MHTRRVATVLAVAVLLATSGCVGFLTGEESLTYSAERATVDADVLGDGATGYTESAVNRTVLERNGEEFGIGNRTVVVENWVVTYEKYDDFVDQTVGVFAVVSTHEVDVVGEPQNPVGNMTESELLDQLSGQYSTAYGDLSNLERTGTEQVTMLGEETDVAVFTGQATVDGRQVEIRVYVSIVKHGDDYVIAVGGHPAQLPDERDDIFDLMANLEHSDEE
ncbi:DUF6517 family protein [Haloarchaeobius sp. HRN-SO-5]|uniref:DUF6517 family protein n=1 Tax=Haloarchaeobius sp. HRN-SO-5 TaxID=3446118 RepID=UPI003EBAADB5